jgi:hypothetical protein
MRLAIRRRRSLSAFGFIGAFGLEQAAASGEPLTVSVRWSSESARSAAARLASELMAEGYTVKAEPISVDSPCSALPSPAGPSSREQAWIALAAKPDGSLEASVCYLGTRPAPAQATTSAADGDAVKLALATAEALNGLRARIAPAAVAPSAPQLKAPPASPNVTEAPASSEVIPNMLRAGPALFWDPSVAPPVLAAALRADLGISKPWSIALDLLVPLGASEISALEATASVRTAWLRFGPSLSFELEDFALSTALLAGPALTWATAEARTPRVGSADVDPGFVASLATGLRYPARAKVFASLDVAASTRPPWARLALGPGTSPELGVVLLDACVGLGARWGD